MVSLTGMRDHSRIMGRKRKQGKNHPGHFLAEWRAFRNMTGEQLAEAADMSVASISQIETGKQGFSMKSLNKIAKALSTDPASLLARDPTDAQNFWSIAERISRAPPEAKRAAIAVLDSFQF